MALEIREMILRTTLTGNNAESGGKKQENNTVKPEVDTEYIIAGCMERLKEWLREENER